MTRYAHPGDPHGRYAVGTRVQMRATGAILEVVHLARYRAEGATRPPSYYLAPVVGGLCQAVAPEQRTYLDAAHLDAYTEVVRGPTPTTFLLTEAGRRGMPVRHDRSGVVVSFGNGARFGVLIMALADGKKTLEDRTWAVWACPHAAPPDATGRTPPTVCATCRAQAPGRVLTTQELVARMRRGIWS